MNKGDAEPEVMLCAALFDYVEHNDPDRLGDMFLGSGRPWAHN